MSSDTWFHIDTFLNTDRYAFLDRLRANTSIPYMERVFGEQNSKEPRVCEQGTQTRSYLIYLEAANMVAGSRHEP